MTADIVTILPNADEASLIADIYNEGQGPRMGIYLTFAKAQDLIRFHLPGKQLAELSYFRRGYNNRVYLARCSDGSEYVIRLGGRFWDHKKITNEAQALALARSVLGDIVQVPVFLGTSIDEAKIHTDESARIVPYDYIIMNRLPGVPLDSVWDQLSQDDKKKVVDQVAEIFARLRSIEMTSIGNFINGLNNEPQIGANMESGVGPFLSWGDFVIGNIQQEIKYMLDAAGNFSETKVFLPRLQTLMEKVKSGDLERQFQNQDALPEGVTAGRPISFLHGDFESRNMLVVGTKITGLHDFEFAGGFPSEQEWCAGFEWLFARAEDPYDEGEQQKLRDMTHDQKDLLDYFLRTLREKHGMVPYGKGNQEYKVVLYHLQANIAPWWLRDPPRDIWTEKQIKSMKTAVDSLEKALVFLGC
ncbi:hypothetical protein BGZ98_010344 [Dissophora globulifera]|nr:hypothetical protein BGZ98_010344 [Dissophora globulifera]